MGAYASKPHKETLTEEGQNGLIAYGASTMQGWRITQEDAHVTELDFDEKTHIFAVFDGHGGAEVAQYAAQSLPQWLKDVPTYKEGDIEKALVDGFVSFDKHLTEEPTIAKLKAIRGIDDDSDVEEEIQEAILLREEADMPIEEVVKKYDGAVAIPPHLRKALQPSPYLKGRPGSSKDSNSCSIPQTSEADKTSERNGNQVKEEEQPKSNGSHNEEKKENGEVPEKPKIEISGEIETATPQGEPQSESIKSDVNMDGEKKTLKGKGKQKKVIVRQEKTTVDPETTYEAFLHDMDDSEEEDDEFGANSDSEEEDDDDEEEDEEDTESEEEEDAEEHEIFSIDESDEPGKGSGCTAVVAIVKDGTLYVANAGDSRCVVSDAGTAVDMSIDHKPEDPIEISRIEKAGGVVTIDGRVNGGLNLSRALGDHTYKENKELPLEEQMISPLPDVKTLKLLPSHDFMVLACDGIWNSMTSQEVVDFVRERIPHKRPGEICEDLFHSCIAPDTEGDGTGCDNMTAIIVTFHKDSVEKVRKAAEEDFSCPPQKKMKRQIDEEPQPSSSGV